MQTIIRAEQITRAFGSLKVLKGVNLEVKQGKYWQLPALRCREINPPSHYRNH